MTKTTRNEEAEGEVVRVIYAGRVYYFVHDDPLDHIFLILKNSSSFYELPLLDALSSLVPRSSTVIDVGANIGTHSVFFAGVMACKVVAIEPSPRAVSLLIQNAQLNGLVDLIEIRECAVGSDRRKGQLTKPGEHNLGTGSVCDDLKGKIEIVPLDQLRIDGDVALIKVDVEGAEYDVLLGAMQLLRRCHPILVFEAPLAEEYKRIATLIEPLGYVPVGSFNYTPTHVFQVPSEERRVTDDVVSISHRLSLHYIDTAGRRVGVDRELSSLKEQLGRVSADKKTMSTRLDAATNILSQTATELEHLRAGMAESEEARATATAELVQQLSGLRRMMTELIESVSDDHERRDSFAKRIATLEDHLSQIWEAIETRSEAQQAELQLLLEAKSDSARELSDRLGVLEKAAQTRLDGIAKIAEQTRIELKSASEATLDKIGLMNAASESRFAATEARTTNFANQLDAALKALQRSDDVLIEFQLLSTTDIDTKFESLRSQIDSALKFKFESRLKAILDERFANLGERLATALGAAIADRKLCDEIADPSRGFDISKAMAVLGIPPFEMTTGNGVGVPIGVTFSPAPGAPDPESLADPEHGVWHVRGYSRAVLKPTVGGQVPPPLPFQKPPSADRPAPLVELDCTAGWEGVGWAQDGTLLEAGGVVSAQTNCVQLGFVTRMIPFHGGGLVEFDVEMLDRSGSATDPIVRLQTDSGFPVGHDFSLGMGRTTVRAFAPSRTENLKLYVLQLHAPAGATFRVGRIAARRLDANAHQRLVSARVKEPVLASMATIPSRREMLKDAVASLLVQCDRVRVFLNNYSDVPDFLMHPRVEVRRSQDWDDRGDAGKFFWIDKDRAEGGYRLIVDDDLIFPPDFVDVMTSKVATNSKRAIFATHGVLVRQPIVRYYEPTSRAITFHFGHAVKVDRGVHIGATNALCFHATAIDMTWDDFKYCNSADVWLSLHAQSKALPVLTPARPSNWIRENMHASPGETIYHHSLKRTRTRFDSSLVQDAVLRHAWPITITPGNRAKVAIAIVADSAEDLATSASYWARQAEKIAATAELIFILVYDATDDGITKAVAELRIPHETHLVDTSKSGGDMLAEITQLQAKLDVDAMLALCDRVSIATPANGSPADVIAGDLTKLVAQITQSARHEISTWHVASTVRCLAFALARGDAGRLALSLLVDPDQLVVAKTRTEGPAFDVADKPISETITTAIEAGEKRAFELLRPTTTNRPHTVNTVFERVLVLNLDRRPDRWERASARLARAGIAAERFSAFDGASPTVAEEYTAYATNPLHTVAPELPKVACSLDFYMKYPSQMARIAHLEINSGKKAIASAGAWGYLKSYEAILERSLANHDETLLVFDDDFVLHRDFHRLFDEAISQLPPDWLIVQLGTLQYDWREPWVQWRTPMLYQTNGVAIGSHAVGMRFEILPYLLDHTKRMDMAFDIGALSAATRAFPDRCFVISPNLAIQALADSDIRSSEFQKGRSVKEIASVYRWKLDDYDY